MRTLLTATLLVTVAFLPLAPDAAASPSNHPVEISLEKSFHGADTFQFSIRYDRTQGDHFNIAGGSSFHVKGFYVGGNGSGEPTQHAAGIRGVVQYQEKKQCFDTNGFDQCFIDIAGVSKKDLTERRVHTDTLGGFTFEEDPNWWAWGSAEGSIVWDTPARFDVPADANQVTIRFFISIPGADRLDIDLHLHSPQAITIRDSTAHEGGFAATTDAFEPSHQVDTWAAEAAFEGQRTVTLEPGSGDALFAGFGPSWFGDSQTLTGTAGHNSVGRSELYLHHPNENTRGGIYYGLAGGGELTVAGQETAGDYVFELANHVGTGPQDIYLVGWKGQTV